MSSQLTNLRSFLLPSSLAMVLISGFGCAHAVKWSSSSPQSHLYLVERDKAVKKQIYTEKDQLKLKVDFGSSKSATFDIDQQTASVTLSSDGSYTPADAAVPLIARIILAVPPPGASRVSQGSTWQVHTPLDGQITDDHLEIQFEHSVTLSSIKQSANSTLLELQLKGRRRIVDNTQIRKLLGIKDPTSVALPANTPISRLASWNPYLIGTVWWNETLGLLESADLELVASPAVLSDFSQIGKVTSRNRLVYNRQN